mgnify:CR=1 FL=1
MNAILTLNAGSSSLKYGVYLAAGDPELIQVGQVENIGPAARILVADQDPKDLVYSYSKNLVQIKDGMRRKRLKVFVINA